MEPTLDDTRLKNIEHALDEIGDSVEKTRKYVYWMFIGSIAMIVLPILFALILAPLVLSTLGSVYSF